MVDWREGGDTNPGRKRSKDKQPKLPASDPGSKDWRGKQSSAAPPKGTPTRQRDWAQHETVSRPLQGVRRRLFIALAAIAIPLLCFWFIRHLFFDPPELPLLVSSPTRYSSDELAENPFGKQAVAAFEQTNWDNIELLKDLADLDGTTQQDTLLDNLRRNVNWQVKYEHGSLRFQDNKILGGGPGRNVVAVYLSGYLLTQRADPSNVRLDLVSTDMDPFRGSGSTESYVGIEELLSRVVNAVATTSKVWIALDVRPVPVVANLGDLECPLSEKVNHWFEKLPKVDQDRTVITLPCKDDQSNWVAPELASSVFSHFYRLGLSGAFDNIATVRENAVTLAEFQSELTRRVDQWVRDNRFAHQTPQWIMSESTKEQAGRIKIVSTEGSLQLPATQTYGSDNPFTKRYRDLDDFWEKFSQLSQAYRWAPVTYAEVESDLIRLEELTEWNAEVATWDDAIDRVRKSLERLAGSATRPPRVSLIENIAASEFYQQNFFQGEPDLTRLHSEIEVWKKNPPWRAKNVATESATPADAKNDEWARAPRDERCIRVLQLLRAHADDENEALWDSIFQHANLEWCLNYVGPPEPTDPEWIEIHLLRLLASEIDWQNEPLIDAKSRQMRSEACARFLRCFGRLQELSSHPDHELSWWLRARLLKLEQDLLSGFDLLAAGQYSQSMTKSRAVEGQLVELKDQCSQLVRAIQVRDEAVWLAPHLLATTLRRYEFAEETQELEKLLEKLASAVTLSQEIFEQLQPRVSESDDDGALGGIGSKVFDTGRELSDLIAELRDSLDLYIASLNAMPQGNPQTVRNVRIALRVPWLDTQKRSQFHRSLSAYYVRSVKDAGADSTESQEKSSNISERPVRMAANQFVNHLNKGGNPAGVYAPLAIGDQRLEVLPTFTGRAAPNSRDLGEVVSELYQAAYKTRQVSLAFGSQPSWRTFQRDWQNSWPWSSVQQFLALGHLYNAQTQMFRFAQAKWGDRNLGAITAADQLYFYRISMAYKTAVATSKLAPTSNLNSKPFERCDEALLSAAKEARDLRIEVSDGASALRANSKAQRLRFQVPTDWSAVSSVYLGRDDHVSFEAQQIQNRVTAVDLGAPQKIHELTLDAEQAQARDLVIAARGNFRSQRLLVSAPVTGQNVEISFDRRQPDTPTIKVVRANMEPTTIMVLLDCSESMESPSAPGSETPAFELAKRTAVQLIKAIESIHESKDSNIRLGLVLFGLNIDPNKAPKLLQQSPLESSQTFYTEVALADSSFTRELVSLIENNLIAKGCTPLYDAIAVALSQAKSDAANLYVISDGFNDTTVQSYQGKRLKHSDVQRLLSNKRILHIYQFASLWNQEKDIGAQRIATAEAELKALTNNRFMRSTSFDELKEGLINSLPKSRVTILDAKEVIASGNFGVSIEVPFGNSGKLPRSLEVRATTGTGPDAHESFQTVQLIGGEDLTLEFTPDDKQLSFMEMSREDTLVDRIPLKPNRILKAASGPDLRFGAQPSFTEPKGEGNLQFLIGMRTERQREVFTPRPTMVLGRLAESGKSDASDYLIADWRFVPDRHYPVFSLPEFAWRRDENHSVPNADLTLWLAFNNLPFEFPVVSIEAGEPKKELKLGVVLERVNEKVIVSVPQPTDPADRLFIVCPQAENSIRQYKAEDLSELHTFTLFSSHTGAATIQLITVGQLERLANNQQVMEVRFKDVKVLK